MSVAAAGSANWPYLSWYLSCALQILQIPTDAKRQSVDASTQVDRYKSACTTDTTDVCGLTSRERLSRVFPGRVRRGVLYGAHMQKSVVSVVHPREQTPAAAGWIAGSVNRTDLFWLAVRTEQIEQIRTDAKRESVLPFAQLGDVKAHSEQIEQMFTGWRHVVNPGVFRLVASLPGRCVGLIYKKVFYLF